MQIEIGRIATLFCQINTTNNGTIFSALTTIIDSTFDNCNTTPYTIVKDSTERPE